MARKKRGDKKRLKRLKKQKLQKLRDLIGRDDHAFIMAHVRMYPKSELSPYREDFWEAVHRETIKALLNGHWEGAKDISRKLPPGHPTISLTEAIYLLSEGKTKEAHVYLDDLTRADIPGDLLPLVIELDRSIENADLGVLNNAIRRAIRGENPRPRMSSQMAKDLWRLFRLLHRPERDGYNLPPTYWRELQRCISDLKDRGLHTIFLEQADKLVQMQREMMTCLTADSNEIEGMLGYWAEDIRRFLIGRGDPSLPKSLRHLAQCVRSTCYRLLTGPESKALLQHFSDILVGLLDVDDTERRDLEEVVSRWSSWTSMVRDRDFDGMRRMLLTYRNSKASTARERFLADIGLYNLAAHDESGMDSFLDFMDDEELDLNLVHGLDALEDAAATIADLPDRNRREAAQVVLARLNDMGEVPIRRQGEIWLTLREYFPRDGALLLAAYAALRLSNSLNALARRTRERLLTEKESLNYNGVQDLLVSLFHSTMDMQYSKAWKEIIALSMELLPRQWPEIEKKLSSCILEEWKDINDTVARPLKGFLATLLDFGLDPDSDIYREVTQFTDRIVRFGRSILGDNPEVLALELLNILIATPAKKRIFSLDKNFNKAPLPIKWRVAVYLGTLNIAAIRDSERLNLGCRALSRILPGIPYDFGHWEEIVSCIEDMQRSIPRRNREYRSLRQLLLKKLRDVQANLNSTESQAIIGKYIDRIR